MLSDDKPILVMDSGVGGLSVVAEIQRLCPTLPIRYLADNAALPYGDKAETWLIGRVLRVVQSVRAKEPISMVVIGCNTASTVVLPALRAQLDIPVVGVVPAIKPAIQLSRSRHIGLLATPGTVRRDYTQRLIAKFAPHAEVTLVGSTELVTQAERKLSGQRVDMVALREAVKPLLDAASLDTVVLGCTHFPLLKAELGQLAPRDIFWVDSGRAIARRVKSLLRGDAVTATEPSYHALHTAPYSDQIKRGFAAHGFTTRFQTL